MQQNSSSWGRVSPGGDCWHQGRPTQRQCTAGKRAERRPSCVQNAGYELELKDVVDFGVSAGGSIFFRSRVREAGNSDRKGRLLCPAPCLAVPSHRRFLTTLRGAMRPSLWPLAASLVSCPMPIFQPCPAVAFCLPARLALFPCTAAALLLFLLQQVRGSAFQWKNKAAVSSATVPNGQICLTHPACRSTPNQVAQTGVGRATAGLYLPR